MQRIAEGYLAQKDSIGHHIWANLRKLSERGNYVTIQWIPGHVGLDGNEEVDALAKEATTLNQNDEPINLEVVKSVLKRRMKENNIKDRTDQRYGNWKIDKAAERLLPRHERTCLAQVRSFHSLIARSYQYRIGKADDPGCPDCNAPEETVLHHLTDCPRWHHQRMRTFDNPTPDSMAGSDIITFLRRTGRIDQRS